MFDFQDRIEKFRQYRHDHSVAYNNAANMLSLDDPPYKAVIQSPQNPIWRVLGIYHLNPEENKAPNEAFGKHHVWVEMLCKQGDREGFRAIHWTWQGRQNNEAAPDVFAGQKPHNELVNIPLNLGMIVSVRTQGSDVVHGLSSNHPDEGPGNTIGHHSFFVCFEEIDQDEPDPPDPDPDPETADLIMRKEWLDSLEADTDGYIRIRLR